MYAQAPRDAGDDAFGVQFGLSVPIWIGKNNSKVNQALAEQSRAVAAKTISTQRYQQQYPFNVFQASKLP
jgi:cobalt-zinc-cadmium efflux system outer membrane protein